MDSLTARQKEIMDLINDYKNKHGYLFLNP